MRSHPKSFDAAKCIQSEIHRHTDKRFIDGVLLQFTHCTMYLAKWSGFPAMAKIHGEWDTWIGPGYPLQLTLTSMVKYNQTILMTDMAWEDLHSSVGWQRVFIRYDFINLDMLQTGYYSKRQSFHMNRHKQTYTGKPSAETIIQNFQVQLNHFKYHR